MSRKSTSILTIFSIALLLSSASACRAEEESPEVLERFREWTPMLVASWRLPDMTHPALGLQPKEAFDPNHLEKVDFKKLCNMSSNDVHPNYWEGAFLKAELDAAQYLEQTLTGKSKNQIERKIGRTWFVGEVPSMLNNKHNADSQRTYFVGGSKIALVLFFSKEKCVDAQVLNRLDTYRFGELGFYMINGYSGMTYSKIRSLNGPLIELNLSRLITTTESHLVKSYTDLAVRMEFPFLLKKGFV